MECQGKLNIGEFSQFLAQMGLFGEPDPGVYILARCPDFFPSSM